MMKIYLYLYHLTDFVLSVPLFGVLILVMVLMRSMLTIRQQGYLII